MRAESSGAFMRWYWSRHAAFLQRSHRGEGRDYRRAPRQALLPFIEKNGQLEFTF